MFFAHSVFAYGKNHPNILNSGSQFIKSLYFKLFGCSPKSIKESKDSWVIVVVLLLTKPTLTWLSGNRQPSWLPDRYNDWGALIFIVTVPEAWRHVSTASDFGPSQWCKRDPVNKRLVWRRQWETADRHNGLYLRSGWCAEKNWAIWKKSSITMYVN